jgi:non-reducing end alpha-L-arabinofuranosidase
MKKKNRFFVTLGLAFALPVAAMMVIAMTGVDRQVTPPRPEGPCDIYGAAGTPCVAAHSSTRALYASYNGPLYQVMRQSDGKTLDIGVVKPKEGDAGGYADAAAQDAFCANTLCLITTLYDQSGKGNHLRQAPPGTFKGPAKGAFDELPIADMAPITISGHKAYGVYIMPGMGLRNNNATDIAINDDPEGIYYVVDGTHYDSGCCFDYGNSSTNSKAVGTGTMETTYYGTASAWGSGNGPGPWIMADMEAGLFSGYNAKKNDVPTIDAWRFVTAVVDGGGGNKWDLRGGNAQKGGLTTYYSGVRPGTPNSKNYSPMSKKGGILLGNGGDNGNGSSGTYYEGVMTTGFPTEATTDAVQANIVAAKYDVQRVSLSRATTFTPGSSQEITATFTNTTGASVSGVKLSISVPKEWASAVSGSAETSKNFTTPVAPGVSVSATFKVTASLKMAAGFLTGKAEWKTPTNAVAQTETVSQRVRSAFPVKINEIRFSTSNNATDQFIELYNASKNTVDISNWTLINTPSLWASVKAATIPAGTKLAPGAYYLLGLSSSGLAGPATKGATVINVRSTAGFEVGQKIDIDGETRAIASIGTAASPMTTIFIPVSTGPWLTIPAGSTNQPVTSAAGFEVGQKIGIEIGGNYELATVTAVGTAAVQTTLAKPAVAGSSNIKLASVANTTVGDVLTVGTGGRKELVKIKNIGTAGAEGTGIDLTTPLKFDNMMGVDVSALGTGISFTPATKFPHKSAESMQALGTGITLDSPLAKNHEYGAAVVNKLATTVGYQGSVAPNQWYGDPLSASAGSIALMDASGKVVVDAMVYGALQGNSSANGYVTTPEIATLEGNQSQGGCIVVVPKASSGDGISRGRYPDGFDTDSNCNDFLLQSASSLSVASSVGATNIKVASVADLLVGQKIFIDNGANAETAIIVKVGTAGATTVATASKVGAKVLSVTNIEGFGSGQTITIDSGSGIETAVVASVVAARRRFGPRTANMPTPTDSIAVTVPLTKEHAVGAQISGSGITLSAQLAKAHDNGAQVTGNLPTPGGPNQYVRKP